MNAPLLLAPENQTPSSSGSSGKGLASLLRIVRFAFRALLTLGIIFCITFLLMEVILRFFPVRNAPHMAALHDDQPIPHYQPYMEGTWSRDWNFSIVNPIRVNNYGFINKQDYDSTAATPLTAVIGDSFVAALMVPYEKTFHGLLAEHHKGRMRVYSFGVSGAPVATYLKWAQYVAREFSPRYMVFTIITNDFDESYHKYKGYPAFYYFYPDGRGGLELDKEDFHITPWRRYLSRNSSLVGYITQNIMLRDRLKSLYHDHLAPKAKTKQSQWPVDESKAAADFFLEQLEKTVPLDNADILFVVDAVDEMIYTPGKDFTGTRPAFEYELNTHFITRAREKGFNVLPLQDIMTQHYANNKKRFDFPTDGHWNHMAHELVYESIIGAPPLQDAE